MLTKNVLLAVIIVIWYRKYSNLASDVYETCTLNPNRNRADVLSICCGAADHQFSNNTNGTTVQYRTGGCCFCTGRRKQNRVFAANQCHTSRSVHSHSAQECERQEHLCFSYALPSRRRRHTDKFRNVRHQDPNRTRRGLPVRLAIHTRSEER